MSPPKKHSDDNISLRIEPLLVGAGAAARLCGISTKYWHILDTTGKVPLPVQAFGRRRLWSVRELDLWIQAGCPSRERWQKQKE